MKAQPQRTPEAGSPLALSGASDAALLQAIATGSEPAFEELRRRYGRAVAGLCRRAAGPEREDCEQEVFARVWRKAALFDPARGSAAAWLLTLARRAAVNAQAGRRAAVALLNDHEPAIGPPDVDAFWHDAALVRLSKRERTVIELAYYRGSQRGCDRETPAGAARLGQELEAAGLAPPCEPARGGAAVRHGEAWRRLPDLLDERDDPGLIDHVRTCATCQRQLFLLRRVDRLLRAEPAAVAVRLPRRRWARRTIRSSAAAAAAALGTLVVVQSGSSHDLTFRTGSGRAVGSAVLSRSDSRNVSLALTARALPVGRGQVFVLWAGDRARAPQQVGLFMVDRSGGCRVRFNLPADQRWSRFWIIRSRAPAVVIARA